MTRSLTTSLLLATSIAALLTGCPASTPTAPTASPSAPAGKTDTPVATPSPAIRTAAAIDGDACEHLTQGPLIGQAASAKASAEAPLVSKPHTAFDLTLPGLGADPTYVRYSVSKAGDYVFYLDKAADLTVTSDANAPVAPKASATSAAGCPVAKVRQVYSLTVGTYMVKIGPTQTSSVTFVAIAADDPGDEKK